MPNALSGERMIVICGRVICFAGRYTKNRRPLIIDKKRSFIEYQRPHQWWNIQVNPHERSVISNFWGESCFGAIEVFYFFNK